MVNEYKKGLGLQMVFDPEISREGDECTPNMLLLDSAQEIVDKKIRETQVVLYEDLLALGERANLTPDEERTFTIILGINVLGESLDNYCGGKEIPLSTLRCRIKGVYRKILPLVVTRPHRVLLRNANKMPCVRQITDDGNLSCDDEYRRARYLTFTRDSCLRRFRKICARNQRIGLPNLDGFLKDDALIADIVLSAMDYLSSRCEKNLSFKLIDRFVATRCRFVVSTLLRRLDDELKKSQFEQDMRNGAEELREYVGRVDRLIDILRAQFLAIIDRTVESSLPRENENTLRVQQGSVWLSAIEGVGDPILDDFDVFPGSNRTQRYKWKERGVTRMISASDSVDSVKEDSEPNFRLLGKFLSGQSPSGRRKRSGRDLSLIDNMDKVKNTPVVIDSSEVRRQEVRKQLENILFDSDAPKAAIDQLFGFEKLYIDFMNSVWDKVSVEDRYSLAAIYLGFLKGFSNEELSIIWPAPRTPRRKKAVFLESFQHFSKVKSLIQGCPEYGELLVFLDGINARRYGKYGKH